MITNLFTGSLLIFPFDEKYVLALLYVKMALEAMVTLYFVNTPKFRSEIKEQIALIKVNDGA